ncbi:NAD(P)H-binding protein [Streptomyces sp. JNUCC 64]
MILVTGASGTIGGEVTRLLGARGLPFRALSRDPSRLLLPASGVPVRGDYDDPVSLDRAVAGVSAVFLLAPPGPDLAAHDRAVIDAARAAGVRRVVKLSAIGTGDPDYGPVGGWHLPGERDLAASGLEWAALRPTTFASNSLGWAGPVRAGRPVPNPTGSGAQGVVDPRDVAEVAVETLTTAGPPGGVHTLTGPRALSLPDQVAVLAEELGRPVGTEEVRPGPLRERMIRAGMDPRFVEMVELGNRLVREGRNTVLTDGVRRVLGRPPWTYERWVRDHREAFLPTG